MSETADRRAYRAVNLLLALALAGAALAPRALSVTADGGALQWRHWRLPNLCLERHTTGEPCPTCRLGRAVVLASNGDWAASAAWHRAGPLVWGWVVAAAAVRAVLAWLAASPRRWRLDAGLSLASLAAVWAAARFVLA